MVIARSACVGAATVVVTVAELFVVTGSVEVVAAVAVLVIIVPAAVPAVTRTTSVKEAAVPAARFAVDAVTVPPLPAAGVVVVHPVGATNDTNVVFAGIVSVSETVAAAAFPLFATPIV